MHGLGGGRRPARKRASSDPTPVNQPNNEGKPSAEVGEGRAQLEENIVRAHMFLTLSREMHVPAFGGVREVDRSLGSLSRHPSFRRAVCVDAHVRICAGGDQRWSSLPRSQPQSKTLLRF